MMPLVAILPVIILTILGLDLSPALAATPTMGDYYERTITKYEHQGIGVFLTSCSLSDSTNIVWFPLGARGGQYVEYFKNGLILNGSDIKFTKNGLAPMDLGGGEGTQDAQRRIIAGLLKSPFQFVPADQLRSTFLRKPKNICSLD
jgi:hypothetical protein